MRRVARSNITTRTFGKLTIFGMVIKLVTEMVRTTTKQARYAIVKIESIILSPVFWSAEEPLAASDSASASSN